MDIEELWKVFAPRVGVWLVQDALAAGATQEAILAQLRLAFLGGVCGGALTIAQLSPNTQMEFLLSVQKFLDARVAEQRQRERGQKGGAGS
jgi:fermentation-respiration switch protein FrsA (DUF1100 family)